MVGKMRWIDEFSGLDGMNAGLTQQWLLTADSSTPLLPISTIVSRGKAMKDSGDQEVAIDSELNLEA